jgi:lysophospholipid acyltransferase (LPLAT)-like uncharacterized protein
VSSPTAATEPAPGAAGYSLWQRFLLTLISWTGFVAICLIAPTLRYTISREEGGPESDFVRPVIWLFWHECIITAAWHWRHREIAVMTSRSFDGEYIARIVEKFGYQAVRGSSTRGGVAALLGMRRQLDRGRSVAFTIDGPQGPRHVAKPGAVLLARISALPLCVFHLSAHHAWVLPTWDRLVVPKPFSRVLLRFSRRIDVPADGGSAELERLQVEVQAALERARDFAEAYWRERRGTTAGR